jgi:cytochrome c oxidase subunit 1
MWGGQYKFNTASLWGVGFIPTFVMGGVTGVQLALPPADFQFHDSYFVVAHFHYVILGGVVFGIFAGIFYWWPKMFGTKLNETLGKWQFAFFFVGFHMTFLIQHWLGLWGMPRRVFTFLPNQGLDTGNLISSIGAYLMGVGTIIFAINMIKTFKNGERAGNDPWVGRTLEWAISSPPPEYNFAQLPLVRGYDALWVEKMAGKKGMTPSEPLGDIHMPNSSFLPFLISLGFFIGGAGFIWKMVDPATTRVPGIIIGIAGLTFMFLMMIVRSVKDDHGYHIHAEELKEMEEGVKS